MKKSYLLLLPVFLWAVTASAQSYTGETKINKLPKTAIINELPFSEDVTEEAIKKRMSQLGYTSKKDNGYLVYKNVNLPELGTSSYNLYFKSERKSKKEQQTSLIYMLISDSYDAFLSESRDMQVINNGKTFLNSFGTPAQDVSIENNIKSEEENLKKAEKKYNNSVDDGKDLEEKKRKIEKDIEENRKDQEQRKVDLDRQRQAVEAAKARRRQ